LGEVFARRYELVDVLGHGGMGWVWRAWDHHEGRYVAAKVLRQSDASSLMRFVREQSFRVHHPHVVTPLGWVGEDDRVLFTMPVVRGGSVSTLLGDHARSRRPGRPCSSTSCWMRCRRCTGRAWCTATSSRRTC